MEYWRTATPSEGEHRLFAMLGSRARSSKPEEDVQEIESTEYIAIDDIERTEYIARDDIERTEYIARDDTERTEYMVRDDKERTEYIDKR